MLKEIRNRSFANGKVYLLETQDGYRIEVTDTFLPYYTKDAVGRRQNALSSTDLGSRKERWMIGVSVMSGCPVRCKFCATGQMKKWRNLTSEEIVEQVQFVIDKAGCLPKDSKEFKINYTRMGEPFLNVDNVKAAITVIDKLYSTPTHLTHHYISTIGITGSDFSWIQNNITLQISLHSLDAARRNWLIPYKNKLDLEELGKIQTGSLLKTTLNLTLVDKEDFNIEKLKTYFDQLKFFIKLSPINENVVSKKHKLGEGIIKGQNII